jgi:uncharacterized protein with beta-barrel porin domain
LARCAGLAAIAAGLCLAASAAHAQSTWIGGTTDWNTATNWSPNTVPPATGTAVFSSTGSTFVDNNSGFVSVGAIQFTAVPNAQAYTIQVDNTFVIGGAGVTNSSTNTQTFSIPSAGAATLDFTNSATANNGTGAVVYNNSFFVEFDKTSNAGNAVTTWNNQSEIMQFFDSSSAGSATINNGAAQVNFFQTSTAGNATIINGDGVSTVGFLSFNGSSTAGNAIITNNTIVGTPSDIEFNDQSTAGSATITNNGMINFNSSANGGAATFTNNTGGTISFNDTSNAGTTASYTSSGTASITFNTSASAGSATFTQNGTSTLTFNDSTTAATATITNNTGTVTFNNTATAGSAAITNANQLTFNNTATAGSATIGNSGTTTFNNGADAGSATITNSLAGVITFNQTSSANTATISNSGNLNFTGGSTASSAVITTNAGGFTSFAGGASGGSAKFVTAAGGTFDISNLTSAGTTAGSIEGAGDYFLGGKKLTVGSLNTSTTVSGIITDGGTGGGAGGALDKVGTGTLTLTNTNLYTGATTIDGGTLTVNGSIALSSGVAINAGGTLNGTGTVSAVTVNSGGILRPGPLGGVGTLTGTGPVTFNAGASYQIFVSGAASSKFTTGGSATLNSSAMVTIANGSSIVAGDKYTILTATGGVTGTFNPTVKFGNFNGTLSYDANDVFLTFNFASLAPLLPPTAPQNPINVANAIDNFLTSGGTLPPGFQALFNLSQGQLLNGLEQLAGENTTGAQIAGFQLMNQFMALLLDPFTEGHNNGIGPVPFAPVGQQATFTPEVASAYAAMLKAPPMVAANPWHAWGAAYGGTAAINGAPATTGSHDMTARAGGFAAGLDYRASADTVFGFALAGAATGWDLSQGFGSGRSDAFQTGVYGTHQLGPAYVSGALAFANYWASTKRVVTVAGSDTLQANFDAQSFAARFEGGYRIEYRPFTLTPYAALQAQAFHIPNFSETAASGSPQFALTFKSQTSSAERAELGSWISRTFAMGDRESVVLFARAAYAHDWFTNLALAPTFQALPGASFAVNGVRPPADLGLVTAGAEWRMSSQWSLMARFDGEFGDGDKTYTGTARLRYQW